MFRHEIYILKGYLDVGLEGTRPEVALTPQNATFRAYEMFRGGNSSNWLPHFLSGLAKQNLQFVGPHPEWSSPKVPTGAQGVTLPPLREKTKKNPKYPGRRPLQPACLVHRGPGLQVESVPKVVVAIGHRARFAQSIETGSS